MLCGALRAACNSIACSSDAVLPAGAAAQQCQPRAAEGAGAPRQQPQRSIPLLRFAWQQLWPIKIVVHPPSELHALCEERLPPDYDSYAT